MGSQWSDEQVEKAARAGQKLAVDWGHQPWSDSWAELVAKTVLESVEPPLDGGPTTETFEAVVADRDRQEARALEAEAEREQARREIAAIEYHRAFQEKRADRAEAALSTAREALSRIRSESFDRYVAPAEYARAVQQIADGALAHLEGGHGE
jgi:recombinational DNA repair protein RecT